MQGDSRGLCVLGDYAWDVLIRTNSELLRRGDELGGDLARRDLVIE